MKLKLNEGEEVKASKGYGKIIMCYYNYYEVIYQQSNKEKNVSLRRWHVKLTPKGWKGLSPVTLKECIR